MRYFFLLVVFSMDVLTVCYTSPAHGQDDAQRLPESWVRTGPVRVPPDTPFEVPVYLTADTLASIYAYHFVLSYDVSMIELDAVIQENTISEGALLNVNRERGGVVEVAAAIELPFRPQGMLLRLSFRSRSVEGAVFMAFDSFSLNEGDPPVAASTGEVVVQHDPSREPVELFVETGELSVGDTTTISLTLNNDDIPIYSGSFSIEYAPELITALGLESRNTLLADRNRLVDHRIEPGVVHLSFATSASLPPVRLPLTKILFSSGDSTGASPIEATNVRINEMERPVDVVHGTLSVVSPVLPGDASSDGVVSFADAILILEYLVGRILLDRDQLDAADVSGNGLVSAYDAALILQFLLGMRACFPRQDGCDGAGKQSRPVSFLPHEAHNAFHWAPASHSGGGAAQRLEWRETDGLPVYALELTLSLPDSMAAPSLDVLDLPPDWIVKHRLNRKRMHITMAGATALPSGALLSVQNESGQFTPFESTIRINEGARASVAALAHPSAAEAPALTPPFPNPFRSSATLIYSLPRADRVSLHVTDLLGRRVRTLVDRTERAGRHEVRLSGQGLSSGCYLIELITRAGHTSRRLVVRR